MCKDDENRHLEFRRFLPDFVAGSAPVLCVYLGFSGLAIINGRARFELVNFKERSASDLVVLVKVREIDGKVQFCRPNEETASEVAEGDIDSNVFVEGRENPADIRRIEGPEVVLIEANADIQDDATVELLPLVLSANPSRGVQLESLSTETVTEQAGGNFTPRVIAEAINDFFERTRQQLEPFSFRGEG